MFIKMYSNCLQMAQIISSIHYSLRPKASSTFRHWQTFVIHCLHVLVIISKYILVNFFAGPTFVIVEYCEHGSLLCYLRNSRLEENGYVNQRYKPSRHLSTQQREPPELLTIRDLLSFAWQTAKGMQYLSEIKVSIKFVFVVIIRRLELQFSLFRKRQPQQFWLSSFGSLVFLISKTFKLFCFERT